MNKLGQKKGTRFVESVARVLETYPDVSSKLSLDQQQKVHDKYVHQYLHATSDQSHEPVPHKHLSPTRYLGFLREQLERPHSEVNSVKDKANARISQVFTWKSGNEAAVLNQSIHEIDDLAQDLSSLIDGELTALGPYFGVGQLHGKCHGYYRELVSLRADMRALTGVTKHWGEKETAQFDRLQESLKQIKQNISDLRSETSSAVSTQLLFKEAQEKLNIQKVNAAEISSLLASVHYEEDDLEADGLAQEALLSRLNAYEEKLKNLKRSMDGRGKR